MLYTQRPRENSAGYTNILQYLTIFVIQMADECNVNNSLRISRIPYRIHGVLHRGVLGRFPEPDAPTKRYLVTIRLRSLVTWNII